MVDFSVKMLVSVVDFLDIVLSYIVINGSVTDPKGIQIVDAIAVMTENLTEFLAQFTIALVNNIPI